MIGRARDSFSLAASLFLAAGCRLLAGRLARELLSLSSAYGLSLFSLFLIRAQANSAIQFISVRRPSWFVELDRAHEGKGEEEEEGEREEDREKPRPLSTIGHRLECPR